MYEWGLFKINKEEIKTALSEHIEINLSEEQKNNLKRLKPICDDFEYLVGIQVFIEEEFNGADLSGFGNRERIWLENREWLWLEGIIEYEEYTLLVDEEVNKPRYDLQYALEDINENTYDLHYYKSGDIEREIDIEICRDILDDFKEILRCLDISYEVFKEVVEEEY